jgi:glycogen debranching enzyme
VDSGLTDASERPTDDEYDRYAYLVRFFRELDYLPAAIRDSSPFALQPALFNALLVQANRDLAEIARAIGSDAARFEAWADRTAAGLESRLWSEEDAVYADFDVRAGDFVEARTAAGLAPLYAGVPSRARAERMVERLADSRVDVGESGWAVTSLAPDNPGFQPTRYWRGPLWPILNWVLQRGLDRYGFPALAARVRSGVIELSRAGGFWEHYSPLTGRGQGGEQFAWTAGLVLDLLYEQSQNGGRGWTEREANQTIDQQRQPSSELGAASGTERS